MDDQPEPSVETLRVLVSFLLLGIVIAIRLFLPTNISTIEVISLGIPYITDICTILTFVGAYFFYRHGSVALAKWFR
ncbi:hypothetical protein [Pasteuria penetrans]|uniref:hypothetical protein n=1 Tax=Pasteuria penetrans TaxID=86005 RepID=UPI0011EDD7D9|nr:hypothetical protein [Pasteuria penetrans]